MIGLIFDIDGVVLDTPHEKAWRETLKIYGFDLSHEVYQSKVAGKSRILGACALFDHFSIDKGKDGSEVKRFSEMKQKMIEKAIKDKDFNVFDSAVDLIIEAKIDGAKIAVASSSKNAKDFLKQINLQSETLYDLFNADVSGKGFKSKPEPDIFLGAANALGLKPDKCVVFEDSVSGVKAAVAGGFHCVAIAKIIPKNAFDGLEAEVIVNNLNEISLEKIKKMIK